METVNRICDQSLVSAIYKRYGTDLKQYFLSYTHNMPAAEDMLHDLFLKLMTIEVINDTTAHSLIFVMARHMIINDVRHKVFVRLCECDMANSLMFYDNSLSRRVEARELLWLEQKKLEAMPAKRAEVYRLYRHEELPSQEIAKSLGLSKRTVEAHIYNATKEMRLFLKHII